MSLLVLKATNPARYERILSEKRTYMKRYLQKIRTQPAKTIYLKNLRVKNPSKSEEMKIKKRDYVKQYREKIKK